MPKFLPSLDDGEPWPPSDFFLNDVVAADHYRKLSPRGFSSSLDELSWSFFSLNLLPRRPAHEYTPPALNPPPKYFQRFTQPTRYSTVINSSAAGWTGTAMRSSVAAPHDYDYRNLPSTLAPKLLYDECRLLRQAYMPQVEGYVEARARVLPHLVKNQLGVSNSSQGSGVHRRKSGGTGVFLPRVAGYTTSSSDYNRNQGTRNRLDIQISEQMNSTTRVNPVAKQDIECHSQLPLEMILPHDWTY